MVAGRLAPALPPFLLVACALLISLPSAICFTPSCLLPLRTTFNSFAATVPARRHASHKRAPFSANLRCSSKVQAEPQQTISYTVQDFFDSFSGEWIGYESEYRADSGDLVPLEYWFGFPEAERRRRRRVDEEGEWRKMRQAMNRYDRQRFDGLMAQVPEYQLPEELVEWGEVVKSYEHLSSSTVASSPFPVSAVVFLVFLILLQSSISCLSCLSLLAFFLSHCPLPLCALSPPFSRSSTPPPPRRLQRRAFASSGHAFFRPSTPLSGTDIDHAAATALTLTVR
eukprot:2137563-Rhodomonas_salina.1